MNPSKALRLDPIDDQQTRHGRAGRFTRAAIGDATLDQLKDRLRLRTAVDLPEGLAQEAVAKYRTLLAAKRLSQDPEVDAVEVVQAAEITLAVAPPIRDALERHRLLGSQRAVPTKLEQAGFSFRYPDLEAALGDILSRE